MKIDIPSNFLFLFAMMNYFAPFPERFRRAFDYLLLVFGLFRLPLQNLAHRPMSNPFEELMLTLRRNMHFSNSDQS